MSWVTPEFVGLQVRWITVWCQGGPANDLRYETPIEPDPVIKVMPDPLHEGRFIRVPDDWPEATTYVRVPDAEQSDHQRIYSPAMI